MPLETKRTITPEGIHHVRHKQSSYEALVRRGVEPGQSEVIDELLADDAVIHGLVDGAGNPVQSTQAFYDFHAQFRSAFPDLIVSVEDAIAEGNMVVARCTVRGRHTGDSLGFAATNAPVQFEGIAITRIENGKIAEAWNHFDFAAMNRQLGL